MPSTPAKSSDSITVPWTGRWSPTESLERRSESKPLRHPKCPDSRRANSRALACQPSHEVYALPTFRMKIWLDGELVDESSAKISVFDHGLLYGDGVFEGIRFYNRRIFRLEEHIKRLFDSARAIVLDLPWTQEEVCRFTVETVAANGLD